MFNPNRKSILSPVIKPSAMLFLLVLGVFAVTIAQAATTLYDNTTGGAITDNACGAPLVRTFSVPTSLIVTDVNLGLNISHSRRGEITVTLQHLGTSVNVMMNGVGDGDSNFDLLLDDSSALPIDDNTNNNIAAPNYGADRTAKPLNALSAFNTQNAQGTWTLLIADCDATDNTGGTFNSSQLQISGTASAVGGTAEYIAVDTAKGMTGWLLVGVSSLAMVMGVVGGLWVWRQR